MADGIFPNGSTLTFSGFSAKVQQIGGYGRNVATADVTPISQNPASYKKMIFSQRVGSDPIEVQFFYKPEDNLPSLGVVQELVITYTDLGRQLHGSAAIIVHNTGDMASDEVIVGTMSIQFEGGDTGTAPVIDDGG